MNDGRETYGDPNVITPIQLNGQKVVSVQKNGDGDIEKFKLSDGSVLSYQEAVSCVKNGSAHGLIAQKGNQGATILRSYPDAHTENNLDNLPTFE